MRAAIIFESYHHHNTEKIVKAIAAAFPVTLIDIREQTDYNVKDYVCIGYASGIAYGKYYGGVVSAAEKTMEEGKKVFFIHTCGKNNRDFAAKLKDLAQQRGCTVLGAFGCIAWDSYGPFKLVGGINKKHPDEKDIQNALDFYRKLNL